MLNKIIRIARTAGYVGQSLRLMVGVPQYSTYVTHMKNTHPDRPVMSYQEFFRERQEARYGGNGKVTRCC
ncbi:MAG: YbdD/YjiX family protein [Nitrosospira sp.]|jgi:uncharacterized short protein YbdD (DUF466 family)